MASHLSQVLKAKVLTWYSPPPTPLLVFISYTFPSFHSSHILTFWMICEYMTEIFLPQSKSSGILSTQPRPLPAHLPCIYMACSLTSLGQGFPALLFKIAVPPPSQHSLFCYLLFLHVIFHHHYVLRN